MTEAQGAGVWGAGREQGEDPPRCEEVQPEEEGPLPFVQEGMTQL